MKIIIPIRGSDFESAYSSYDTFLNEINEISENRKLISLIDDIVTWDKFEIPRIEKFIVAIKQGSIHFNSLPSEIEEIRKAYSFFHVETVSEFLVIDFAIKSENQDNDFTTFLVNDYLIRLNLIINLTYSTNIDFLPGIITSDSEKLIGKTKTIICSVMNAYEHSSKMNWPKIKNLSIHDTIEWFHKFDIHPNFISKNNAHRAINAFSQLIGDVKTSNTGDLFWIMLGIESLLAEGSQGMTKQIKDKSILILGEPEEYKKKLNKLYDYRSRLIHGNINIFPSFYTDFESFDIEYSDYLDFAISILIALIRELIFNGENKFEFELNLK